jgi:methylglyoxal synthase
MNTGLYEEDQVHFLFSGRSGGVVQLAAMVAQGECAAVIFLSDPRDLWADVPENRALKRVCMELNVRLITTYAGAEEWALYEAEEAAQEVPSSSAIKWPPGGWEEGKRNVTDERPLQPLDLPIEQRTIALIAHDQMKDHMARFVESHIDRLAKFHRILATGTTGWLLRLRHAAFDELQNLERLAKESIGDRFIEVQRTIARLDRGEPNREFTKKIIPLASGPRGGDVLIANEVLEHRCHTIIFFYDPETAHPHAPDIRLLERAAQIPWVYAVCVSDPKSAEKWAQGLARREGA